MLTPDEIIEYATQAVFRVGCLILAVGFALGALVVWMITRLVSP